MMNPRSVAASMLIAAAAVGVFLAPAASATTTTPAAKHVATAPVSGPSAKKVSAPTPASADPLEVEPTTHPNHPKVTGRVATNLASTTSTLGPFLAGTAYADAYWQGDVVQHFIARYGVCDTTGYKWAMNAHPYPWYDSRALLLSRDLVSSIRQGMFPGSRCNYLILTAFNGGQTYATCVRPTALQTIGNPWNDNVGSFRLMNRPQCPAV